VFSGGPLSAGPSPPHYGLDDVLGTGTGPYGTFLLFSFESLAWTGQPRISSPPFRRQPFPFALPKFGGLSAFRNLGHLFPLGLFFPPPVFTPGIPSRAPRRFPGRFLFHLLFCPPCLWERRRPPLGAMDFFCLSCGRKNRKLPFPFLPGTGFFSELVAPRPCSPTSSLARSAGCSRGVLFAVKGLSRRLFSLCIPPSCRVGPLPLGVSEGGFSCPPRLPANGFRHLPPPPYFEMLFLAGGGGDVRSGKGPFLLKVGLPVAASAFPPSPGQMDPLDLDSPPFVFGRSST